MTHATPSVSLSHFIETLPGKTVREGALLARQAGFFIARADQLEDSARFRLDRVVVTLRGDGFIDQAFVR